ncbi:hypothetical protein OSB04_021557 [Centaurea solstitialis]|uniref:Mediator of RNA polymerase II transcription subunit 19a n=1 Tax=Centaurea solstitialis TaxID=347529 RepID=A0AA38SUE7_9ASTR|nr:hypothetical protein OSB04_021557 [Centaurea solstitialis]
MDPESKKFGKGPRELTGAVDLISYYKLLPHHEFFCKKSLPVSISDTHYLHNVPGDSEIRKGEGMQLDQLIQTSFPRETNTRIQPFDLDILREAFQLRETAPVDLPSSEKGIPTVAGKSKSEAKDKEKKHKKHKDKDRDKDKEHKKHKHRHKDRSKEKDKEKKKRKAVIMILVPNPQRNTMKGWLHLDYLVSVKYLFELIDGNADVKGKRKHDGDEDFNDIHRHKKSKHKSSKIDEMGAIKVAA